MSGPGDWLQFYHQNLSTMAAVTAAPPSDHHATSEMPFIDRLSDATVVSTTSAAPTTVSTALSPEGRVGKPIRRRSRASRRTPTTLLNTDTTNFRAMVQQFTGGPATPFAASISYSGASNYGLGLGIRQSELGSHPAAFFSPTAGYRHLQPQQQQFYDGGHQNPQQFVFQSAAAAVHGDGFMQRLSETRRINGGVSTEEFLMESSVSSRIPSSKPANDSHGGNESFMF